MVISHSLFRYYKCDSCINAQNGLFLCPNLTGNPYITHSKAYGGSYSAYTMRVTICNYI